MRVGGKNSEGFGLVCFVGALCLLWARGKVWLECGLQRAVPRGLEWGGDEEEEEVARVEGGAGLPLGTRWCLTVFGCSDDPDDCHVGARWCLTVFGCSDASQILAVAMWLHGGD